MEFEGSLATRVCRAAGLHRTAEPAAGWIDEHGSPISDEVLLSRLRALQIPPAWREVWASFDPDARVQATGVDARGRTQYRYSAAAEQESAERKFANLLIFGDSIPKLRTQVAWHLAYLTGDSVEHRVKRVTAAVVRLIDRGLFRVGSDRYARDNHTYGLTTLTSRHVQVSGSAIEFTFVGKEHRPWHLTIDDPDVAEIMARLLEEGTDAEAPLFSVNSGAGRYTVGSAAVNSYIHGSTAAPATAKTFRTWGGTAAAAAMSAGALSPIALRTRRPDLMAYDVAAHLLGNTREVARRSYVHPLAMEAGRGPGVAAAIERAVSSSGKSDLRSLLDDDEVVASMVRELSRLSHSEQRPQELR
jgi:DNA topoisomerase-1